MRASVTCVCVLLAGSYGLWVQARPWNPPVPNPTPLPLPLPSAQAAPGGVPGVMYADSSRDRARADQARRAAEQRERGDFHTDGVNTRIDNPVATSANSGAYTPVYNAGAAGNNNGVNTRIDNPAATGWRANPITGGRGTAR